MSVQVLLEGYSEGGMGSTMLGQEQKSDSTSDATVLLACKFRLLHVPMETNIIVPTYHCRL